MLKSLLPEIRFRVYDSLYDRFKDSPDHLEFLPYKQTLFLLSENRSHIKDYSETIFYKSIDCYHPDALFFVKNHVEYDFVEKYKMNWKRNYTYINYSSDDENDDDAFLQGLLTPININNAIIPRTDPTLRVDIQAQNILNEIIFELQNEMNNDVIEMNNDVIEITIGINEITSGVEITSDVEITSGVTEINSETLQTNTTINSLDSNPSVTFNSYSLIIHLSDSEEDQ